MVEPISITCPHCSASIKVKKSSSFGKKVKCPQCAEPFVLEKPTVGKPAKSKKKVKNVMQNDVFDWDDPDVESELLDDDFDDWEDDLNNAPVPKSGAKKTKKKNTPPKKRKTESSFSVRDYGLSPFCTYTSIFLIIINLVCLMSQNGPLMFLGGFLTILFGLGCMFGGGIGFLVVAARESVGELFLCMIVPFYSLYYLISRFDETKYSFATYMNGVILFIFSYVLFFAASTDTGFFKKSGSTQVEDLAVQDPNLDIPAPINREGLDRKAPSGFPEIRRPNLPAENKQLAKFDLSQVKPMLMSWPSADGAAGSGFEVYGKRRSNSIGTVYNAMNINRNSDESPPGRNMKFRVSLPPNIDPDSPVPCILIPPAGSNLMTGRDIDYNDNSAHPEHEPYLKAGFAVVTFSLDGNFTGGDQATDLQLRLAYQEFKKSKAGLVNCVHAFLETQAVIPGIDKKNVFIAGHSSAATLSLLFAEHFPQIKGCLAYAPEVDVRQRMEEYLPDLKKVIPDIENFLIMSSPKTHVKDLKCPVFLFHARGDQNTSFADSEKFAAQLKAQGTEVEFVASSGSDHYQTMIDEGIPQGIEWLKKQITQSKQPSTEPQMAATSKPTLEIPEPKKKDFIDLTRRKATYKVTGFSDFLESAIKSNPKFWKSSAEGDLEKGLKDLVTGYSPGSVKIDLVAMTASFEYIGALPSDLPEKLGDHFFAKAVKVAGSPLSVDIVTNTPNSLVKDSNFLTFRIRNFNRIRFNRKGAPKVLEAYLSQNQNYVPNSLRINYEQKWVYIKLKGIDNQYSVGQTASKAFSMAGLFVTQEKMTLSSAELATGVISTSSNSGSTKKMTPAESSASPTNPQPTVKQKYIIKYGIYSGKNIKESAKRTLKGFVWVDQKTIQVNPDAKEISFINRSPVNIEWLNRALKRNKIYQVNITQEALPKEKPEPKKEAAKAGTD